MAFAILEAYALNTRTHGQRADSDFRILCAYGFYFRAEFVQEGVYWFLQLNTHIVGIQLSYIRCRFGVGAQFRCFDFGWRARGRFSTRRVHGIERMDRRVTNEAGKVRKEQSRGDCHRTGSNPSVLVDDRHGSRQLGSIALFVRLQVRLCECMLLQVASVQ